MKNYDERADEAAKRLEEALKIAKPSQDGGHGYIVTKLAPNEKPKGKPITLEQQVEQEAEERDTETFLKFLRNTPPTAR